MTPSVALWLGGLAAAPLVVVGARLAGMNVERLRWVAVVCAGALVAFTSIVLFVPDLGSFAIDSPAWGGPLGGPTLVRVNTFSAVLLPLAALLWLITVAVTPRARLGAAGLQRTALATLVTIACFLTESPALLVVLWFLSTWLLVAGLSDRAHRRARNVALAYLGTSCLLLASGVLVVTYSDAMRAHGLVLIAVAALIRKGIFPFHAWVPEMFARGRLGPVVLFSAPQIGAYTTVVLIVPNASDGLLRVVAVLALGTAVYGAVLSTVQSDARRACGYLFTSQSALVMAGLDCSSQDALAGSLVLWVSSALAFTGLARCVLVLEARRGRLDLDTYHGGYSQMPALAVSFLVMGLACTGFPGTLGFIGEEMLARGGIGVFTVLGFCVIIAGAFTGLGALRMYFSLFCGPTDDRVALRLRRREVVAFTALAMALICGGVVPTRVVESRMVASEMIMAARAHPVDADPVRDH